MLGVTEHLPSATSVDIISGFSETTASGMLGVSHGLISGSRHTSEDCLSAGVSDRESFEAIGALHSTTWSIVSGILDWSLGRFDAFTPSHRNFAHAPGNRLCLCREACVAKGTWATCMGAAAATLVATCSWNASCVDFFGLRHLRRCGMLGVVVKASSDG
jgi:hypothetical protein